MYDELTTDLRRAANTWLAEEYKVCAEAVRYLLKESADAIEELATNYDAATDIMKHQTEYIEELEAKFPRWIPVTERLPKETDGMVFVLMPDVFPYNSKQPFVNCNQDRRIDMAHYSEHSKTWYFGDCGAVGGQEPIAWIHRSALPEPPKEET
jgi:hypothetical protein